MSHLQNDLFVAVRLDSMRCSAQEQFALGHVATQSQNDSCVDKQSADDSKPSCITN